MIVISSTDFGTPTGANITGEYAIVQQALAEDVGLLAVVVALRGLSSGSATRELRVYLDGVAIAGASSDNVPANQSDRFFPESLGATTTRLSVLIPAVRAGQTIDVRIRSSHAGDTAVAGTCEIVNCDLFTAGQAAALLNELHLCKAALVNRQVQTIATGVVQIMDDDGVTPLRTLTPIVDDVNAPTQNVLGVE
ncbi:MAG: hypothetical protein L6R00_05705 [Phycisphaerae bacterium]|nr:hypothetical protein [Phycisphaerae bacterium]